MYSPVTTRFLASCRSSAKVATTADMYVAGTLVKSNLPITAGSLTIDSTANIRRSAHITVVNPDAAQDQFNSLSTSKQGLQSGKTLTAADPRAFFSAIDIYQTEIVIKSGFVYEGGKTELVPMGRFMVWSGNLDFGQGNVIEMELYDRAKYIEQVEILKLLDFSGQTVQAAIQSLVTQGLPVNQTVNFDASLPNTVLPGGTTYDNNLLDAILDLCDTIGAQFYFDVTGAAQVKPKKTLSPTAVIANSVFELSTGTDGNVIDLSRAVSRDEIYNGVGVYGAQPNDSSPQAYGEAFDFNTQSRTYWQGPFGKAFKRLDRPELTTNAQCYEAAVAELNRSVQGALPTNVTITPNPALDIDDQVTVRFPAGSPEIHLIDSIDYDFDTVEMSLTTRGKTT